MNEKLYADYADTKARQKAARQESSKKGSGVEVLEPDDLSQDVPSEPAPTQGSTQASGPSARSSLSGRACCKGAIR